MCLLHAQLCHICADGEQWFFQLQSLKPHVGRLQRLGNRDAGVGRLYVERDQHFVLGELNVLTISANSCVFLTNSPGGSIR
jgi:hypothetical protein